MNNVKQFFIYIDSHFLNARLLFLGLLNLHVRRGSEPALNQLPHTLLPNGENCKRWSAAILASSENFKQLNSEVTVVACFISSSILIYQKINLNFILWYPHEIVWCYWLIQELVTYTSVSLDVNPYLNFYLI